jgi:hypothetical protein
MNVSQIYDNETPIELEIKVAKEAANLRRCLHDRLGQRVLGDFAAC